MHVAVEVTMILLTLLVDLLVVRELVSIGNG